MVLQAFWSLKHSGIFRLIETKRTFANLAFTPNVSKRAVRMKSVAHNTSEMQGHENGCLILGTAVGMGLSKQKNMEKPNCLGLDC